MENQELLNNVSSTINQLRVQLTPFQLLENLKSLEDILIPRDTRKVITQHLSRLGFAELAIKILKSLECKKGKYAKVDVWRPISVMYGIMINTSDTDAVICLRYMENGVVEFMKENCCSEDYSSRKCEKYIEIVNSSIIILYNISRFFSIKEKCGNSVNWLIPMLSVTKTDIKMNSLLLLSHMVEVNNNAVLRDNEGCIGHIVELLQGAVMCVDQYHDGYSLWELLSAIGNLAKNDFNRVQLMQREVLKLLIISIQRNNDHIQVLSMNVILTMMLDDYILNMCSPSFLDEELRPILEAKANSNNFILSNNSRSALQLINDRR